MITPEIKAEILACLAENDKIRARSIAFLYSSSLGEADEYLEHLQQPRTHPEFLAYAAQGQWLDAVKYVKNWTGWDLRASKEYVDAFRAENVHETQTNEIVSEEEKSAYVRRSALAYIARGEVIAAIKFVRDETGMGLREAKDYVEFLREDGAEDAPLEVAPSTQETNEARIRQVALDYVSRGEIISAVKFVREETGMGLRESKDYVDALR